MDEREREVRLQRLLRQADRSRISRRGFISRAGVLGVSVTTASALFAACSSDDSGSENSVSSGDSGSDGSSTGGESVARLPELSELPADMQAAYPTVTAGKSMIYIGIFGAHPQIAFYDQLFKGEAERLGMDYAYLDSAFDPAKELANLDQAISSKHDVILLHPVDPSGASPQVKRAREQGTIVINLQTDTVERPTIKHGWNWYENASITADWLGEKLAGKGKVVAMVGEVGSTAGKGRKAGFSDQLASKWPDIELLEFVENAGWNQDGGYEQAQVVLQKHPDIDAIAALEDQQAIGARKAVDDAGREGIIITGADGQKEGQEAVADGRIDMSVMMLRGFGPEALGAIDMMEALIRGEVPGNAIQAAHFPPQITVTKDTIADQWSSPV